MYRAKSGKNNTAAKRQRTMLLLSAVVLLFCFSNSTAAASERKTVRVGYFPFDGYHMEDEQGVRSGYGYDILQEMLVYENWKYDYIGYDENISWEKAQEMLDDGEVDLLTSAAMTQDRLDKYDYSKIPIGSSSTMLTVKAGDSRFETEDYTNWTNLHVGMLANSSRNLSFDEYASEHGFTYEEKEYDTPDTMLADLKNGTLDMVITSNFLSMDGVRIVDKIDEKPIYVIVKKGNSTLLSEVNDALTKVQAKNSSFAEDLYSTYYNPKSDGVVSFTREEQNFINQCNQDGVVFQALMNPDRKPLSYRADGQMEGLLPTICREIFDRTGLNIQFVDVEKRDQYVEKLKEGTAAVVCDFTGSVSAAENYGYIRTSAYYNSSTSMLVKKDYDGSGTRCALTRRSITNAALADREGIEYTYYDTMEECKDAVLKDEVDFTYGYTRTVQEMVYEDVTNSLACITVTYMPVDFYMGTSLQENALLTSIISKSVDSISEKDISYLSEPFTYYNRRQVSLTGIIYEYPLLLIIIIILIFTILLGVILLAFNMKRRREEKELNEKLSAALKEAERANEAKTAFLSRVSHDMRTPLNGILGLIEILQEKADDPEICQDLSEMELSGRYLLNLINDTLDISRIENGRFELHPTVCGGKMLLDNTIRLTRISAQKKNIRLETEIGNLPYGMLFIDIGRVQQVLMNVLSNAVKFTPEGGRVKLTIRNLSVENGIVTDEYKVEDDGIGISPEFLPHLFESFAQEDASRTSVYQGTGLGMAITKQILDAMGGTISVESEVGKGSCFTFTIPLQLADEKQIAQAESTVDTSDEASAFYGKRVLLCEDHPLNARIAVRLLETRKMVVDHAENGKIGVDLFAKSEPGYYDLILMDVRMPVMDGLDAARAIRKLSRSDAECIPIIAMTANAFYEDVKQTQAAGMNAHLSKPIDKSVFFQTIERILQEGRRWNEKENMGLQDQLPF